MIVDCHTTIWETPAQLGQLADPLRRAVGGPLPAANAASHADRAACVTHSLVLPLRSTFLGADVPNELVAHYVEADPARVIGVAGIDPTDDDATEQVERWLGEPAFRGLAIAPCDQNFHPADSRAMALYDLADQRSAVVIFRQGGHFHSRVCLEYARPSLLDEIAREFPHLTIVITSLGFPWVHETLALLDKHERVFADIAGLTRQPWRAYTALADAHQYGVMDKVLFASGSPLVAPPRPSRPSTDCTR